MREFARRNGVELLSCTLCDGKAKGQAAITAIITPSLLPKSSTTTTSNSNSSNNNNNHNHAALIANALREKDCCGRSIRIQDVNNDGKKRRSSAGRYFIEGMNIKCNNCSLVGHKANDCPSPIILPPCHLCAGQDHESRM